MTPEQKKRATNLLALRHAERGTDLARYQQGVIALLQELIDAPEVLPATNPSQISSSAEPFGYFKAEPFGWTDCAETDDGAIALYTAPQPPKLSDERILEIGAMAKAEWNAAADQYNQWRELDSDEITILIARAIEREILGGAQA